MGGWSEFSSWLRAFPWLRYQGKPFVWWYVAGPVLGYYVDPNFHEPMDRDDFAGYLRYRYPPHPSSGTDATVDPALDTGRVSFRDPARALRYAGDLERAMYELGVLCSPVVGIGGHTDRLRRLAGGEPAEGEGRRANGGLPQPEEFEEELIFDLANLERRRRRSAELERRLGDPNIPDPRKAEIRRALRDERELERDAIRNLEGRAREEIYGLALGLARERDRIADEKRHAELLLDAVREGLPT